MRRVLLGVLLLAMVFSAPALKADQAAGAQPSIQELHSSIFQGPDGLTTPLAPQNAATLTCRELLEQCSAACDPADPYCGQDCQCQFLNCRGYQCN